MRFVDYRGADVVESDHDCYRLYEYFCRQGTNFTIATNNLLRMSEPKKRPGSEFAGEIEAVGMDVTLFESGDRVFGSTVPSMGAHAEYVCLPEDGVMTEIPAHLTYEETAGVCDGGLTALYFLRKKAEIQRGHRVLINGASGAVGSYAVQLATYYGADVTGVCSTTNVELVRSLGADEVIDYTDEAFTDRDATYDIIFDTVGTSSYSRCKPVLTEQGVYLGTAASLPTFLHMVWTAKRRGTHTHGHKYVKTSGTLMVSRAESAAS